jgi:single-strand DNA-binding protein
MASNINRVTLLGHVGQEPKFRVASSGIEGVNFTIATNKKWKDREGNWQSRSEWHNVISWNKYLVQKLKENSPKVGDLVYVEGSISYDSWEDKQGNKQMSVSIIADNVSPIAPGKSIIPDEHVIPPKHIERRGYYKSTVPF